MPATTFARAHEMGRDTMPSPPPTVTATVTRVRAEYDEMPGLCLTARQAERLFGLDRDRCIDVLDALVDLGFLRRVPDGYIRAS
jgi:hypothetical protein